ncbi:hypothetical protein FBU30_010432, partial [Linnemannia zychae]
DDTTTTNLQQWQQGQQQQDMNDSSSGLYPPPPEYEDPIDPGPGDVEISPPSDEGYAREQITVETLDHERTDTLHP